MALWLNEFLLILASACCWATAVFVGSDFTRWHNNKRHSLAVNVFSSILIQLFLRGLLILVPIFVLKDRFASDEWLILMLIITCVLSLCLVVATNKLDVRG